MKNNSLKILLILGKTGGHIFPPLSLAKDAEREGYKVYIASSQSQAEKKALAGENFSVYTLPISRLRKGVFVLERIKSFFLLPYYFLRAFVLVLKLKPDVMVGCGGALSGPLILSGVILRSKTFIWELNAVFGWTNKILSSFVDRIFICFESAGKNFPEKKCVKVLFPVRENVRKKAKTPREPDGFSHLLILGGSQGSLKINQAALDMYRRGHLETWKIRHQTGERDFNSIQNIYNENKVGEKVECRPFFEDMGECYQWADLVISRSGASTLFELSAAKKAAIIIPLKSSPDNHQYLNALYFYEKKAIKLLTEEELNASSLLELIMNIYGKTKRELEENIGKLYSFEKEKSPLHFLK